MTETVAARVDALLASAAEGYAGCFISCNCSVTSVDAVTTTPSPVAASTEGPGAPQHIAAAATTHRPRPVPVPTRAASPGPSTNATTPGGNRGPQQHQPAGAFAGSDLGC